MNWKSVLTKRQKQSLMVGATKALKKLLSSPARKDLIEPVELGRYVRGDNYGILTLNKGGLWKEEGYNDSFPDPSQENNSYHREPVKVKKEDFEEIVEEYELIPEKLEKIRISIEN